MLMSNRTNVIIWCCCPCPKDRRGSVAAHVKVAASAALRRYEDITFQEKLIDKAFKREFGARQDVYDEALRAYRDRRRALTGNPIRSPTDVLNKVPEGQQQNSSTSPGENSEGSAFDMFSNFMWICLQ